MNKEQIKELATNYANDQWKNINDTDELDICKAVAIENSTDDFLAGFDAGVKHADRSNAEKLISDFIKWANTKSHWITIPETMGSEYLSLPPKPTEQ